jgi:DNA uptake protein ComE-like DNA-binding protein
VKENTAEATAALKSNAKAVASGVVEGLRRPTAEKPIDINSGSKGSLKSLPGVSDSDADRIVAGRPYTSTRELVERRILSRDTYDKIADRLTVKK